MIKIGFGAGIWTGIVVLTEFADNNDSVYLPNSSFRIKRNYGFEKDTDLLKADV